MSVDEQDEQQEGQPAPDAVADATAAAEAEAPAGAEASAPVSGEQAAPAWRPDDRRPRGEAHDRGGGRFGRRRRPCAFCLEKASVINYKDPGKLRRYVSDRGRIEPQRKTGTCTKHQRWLSVALKRARLLALLPYTPEHIRVSGTFTTRSR